MSLSASENVSGFTVTCPSNSNMVSHPHNVGSNFILKLPKPLRFCRQTLNEDVQWQVAMLSIHYAHNFHNLCETCMIYMVVEAPKVRNMRPGFQSPECFSIGYPPSPDAPCDEVEKSLLASYITVPNIRTASTYVGLDDDGFLGKVKLPSKHYASITSICDEIVFQFNKLFSPRYNIVLQIARNRDGRLTFSLKTGQRVMMYSTSSYIGHVLGLESRIVIIPAEVSSSGRAINLYKLENIGTRLPTLGGIQALYIYSDIVEYQVVGDTLSPLLAYVDVEKSPGERVGHICSPLVYLPVSKSDIDTIGIRICDEHGNEVNFPDDAENVVVRLHFRKRNNSRLL